jgi:hypothetical protein
VPKTKGIPVIMMIRGLWKLPCWKSLRLREKGSCGIDRKESRGSGWRSEERYVSRREKSAEKRLRGI